MIQMFPDGEEMKQEETEKLSLRKYCFIINDSFLQYLEQRALLLPYLSVLYVTIGEAGWRSMKYF